MSIFNNCPVIIFVNTFLVRKRRIIVYFAYKKLLYLRKAEELFVFINVVGLNIDVLFVCLSVWLFIMVLINFNLMLNVEYFLKFISKNLFYLHFMFSSLFLIAYSQLYIA